MILKSYAKVNLYLEVIDKRPDNYHSLKTIFERIDLCDEIRLTRREDSLIRIFSDSKEVPQDCTNLAYRSAELLQKKYRLKKGVDIRIKKRIPVGAGLGGGSGNAAAVLLGLNKLWKLKLSNKQLAGLGARLGSDVSFFAFDVPFAQGLGRGEKIRVLNNLKKVVVWHILVVPRIHVSTPRIYKEWDRLRENKKPLLTRPFSSVKIMASALKNKSVQGIGKALFNSLEKITTGLHPELIKIQDRLRSLGSAGILMSGSGPAVFGIVSSRKEAARFARQLKGNAFWRVYVTRTR